MIHIMKIKPLKITPEILTELNKVNDNTELGILFSAIIHEHKKWIWIDISEMTTSFELINIYASIKAKTDIFRKSNKALMKYRLDPNSISNPDKNVERVLANDIGRSFGDLTVISQNKNIVTARSETTGKDYTYAITMFETGKVKGRTRNKDIKPFNSADRMKWTVAFDLFYKKLYLGFFLKHHKSTKLALPFAKWSEHYFSQIANIQFKLLDENGIPQKYWQYYTGYELSKSDPESVTPELKIFESPSHSHFAIPVYSESRLTAKARLSHSQK